MCTGEKISLYDLVHGILLKSGNEAAISVAIAVSGDVETFVKNMNSKAQELGMTNTHFVTPHGLQNEDHYTTASDMAKLARYAMQNETFAEIVNKLTYTTSSSVAGSKAHELTNTNHLLNPEKTEYYYSYANGIKTGSTPTANGCLVASAKKGDMNLIVTIFNDGTEDGLKRWKYAIDLFNYGFENFISIDISDILSEIVLEPVQIKNASATDSLKGELALEVLLDEDSASGVLSSVAQAAKENPEKIEVEITYDKKLEAPIVKGETLGTATATYEGQYLGTFSVAASRDVKADDPLVSTTELPIVSINPDLAEDDKPADKRMGLILPFAILAVLIIVAFLWLRGKKRKRLVSRKKRSYAKTSPPYNLQRTTVNRRKKKKR